MKETFKVVIESPCHENWEEMTPNNKGRHCQSCDKTVVDFKHMSDSEIFNYFQSHQNICGNFYSYQLEKIYKEPLEVSKNSAYKKWLVAALNFLVINLSAQQIKGKFIGKPMTNVVSKDTGQLLGEAVKPDTSKVVFTKLIGDTVVSFEPKDTLTQSIESNANDSLPPVKIGDVIENPLQIFQGDIINETEFEFPTTVGFSIPNNAITGLATIPYDSNILSNKKSDSISDALLENKHGYLNEKELKEEDDEYRETGLFYFYLFAVIFAIVGFFIYLFRRFKNMKN